MAKAAFVDVVFVDARQKRHSLKVVASCSTKTCIFVLSSHNCFAFNNQATVATEDKDESFFEEEEEEDTGAKE